jgi:hypothetical protein
MPSRHGSILAISDSFAILRRSSPPLLPLLPVAIAALLLAAASAIAEAPFEIAALAPPWTAAIFGLCLASRSIAAPIFAATFAPLAVVALAPGTRWFAVQAVAVVAALEVARTWARRLRTTEAQPTFAELFGIALALHALLAARQLVPWESTPRQVFLLLAPPLVAALAGWRLVRTPSSASGLPTPLLLTWLALSAIGPGFTIPVLLTLVAFAAANEFRDGASTRSHRNVASVLIALPCFFETRIGILAAASAAVWAWPSPLPRLLLPAGVAALAFWTRLREPAEVLPELAWLAALAPALWFLPRADRVLGLSALLLGLAGLLALPEGPGQLGTLAPALALLLLAMRRGQRVQGAWSLGAVALAALAAGFPWLGVDPLETVRRAIDLPGALSGGWVWHGRHVSRDELGGSDEAGGARGPAGANGDPSILARIVVEDSVSQVAVVSQMANAARLPAGSTVAVLRARGANGERLTFPLRAGIDTGEWAAQREQVAAPQPWRSFLAPLSAANPRAGCEIGNIYRAHFAFGSLAPPVVLEVERAATLPATTILEVRGLEWRR